MGANGSHASGILETEAGKAYKTLFKLGDNIIYLSQKNPKQEGKLPEESHTPNRVYVSFKADGKDVKAVAQYGGDGKKLWEIHTGNHYGLSPHYHIWKDGKPASNDAHPLTQEMTKLLKYIRDYGK